MKKRSGIIPRRLNDAREDVMTCLKDRWGLVGNYVCRIDGLEVQKLRGALFDSS